MFAIVKSFDANIAIFGNFVFDFHSLYGIMLNSNEILAQKLLNITKKLKSFNHFSCFVTLTSIHFSYLKLQKKT